jgi:hypothetical protein
MPLKSSSISKVRGKRTTPADHPPPTINSDDNSGPDYEGEMRKLAQQSLGDSPFHGHRGLQGPTLVDDFTVAGGFKHPVSGDRSQATVFRDAKDREKLADSLAKSVGGPNSRNGKKSKVKIVPARGTANDTTLYG